MVHSLMPKVKPLHKLMDQAMNVRCFVSKALLSIADRCAKLEDLKLKHLTQ